jgi:predicted PP-loop superfamily ATPase
VNAIERFPASQKTKRVNAPGAGRPRATLTAEEILRRRAAGETHAMIAAAEGIGASTPGKILRRAGATKVYGHRVWVGKGGV